MVVAFIKANAKAIAVPVASLLTVGAVRLFDMAGIDVTFDRDGVAEAVAVVIVTAAVWLKKNTAPDAPAGRDV